MRISACYFFSICILFQWGCFSDKQSRKIPDCNTSISFAMCSTPFDSVNAIRRWVASNINVGNPALDKDFPQINYWELSKDSLWRILMQPDMAARCGTTACALKKIYTSFNFEAINMDMGFYGTPCTHVTCLVKIPIAGSNSCYVVQDAFFNITYTYPDGSPLPYDTLKMYISRQQFSAYKLKQDVDTCNMLFEHNRAFTKIDSMNAVMCLGYMPPIRQVPSNSGKLFSFPYVRRYPAETLPCDDWWKVFKDSLNGRGMPTRFESLYNLEFNRL